jgi:hypothetical protein
MIAITLKGQEQEIWFIISLMPFIALSIVTIYLGWLMVARKQLILYPHENFGLRFAYRFRGPQAADRLKEKYLKTSRRVLLGTLNLITGGIGLLVAILLLYLFIA